MSARHHGGWPLIAIVAWGGLSFGAVYPWAYWPLFAAATIVGLEGTLGDKAWRDPRLRHLLIAIGLVAAAILVQTLALPSWLVVALSPATDRFFRAYQIGYHPANLNALSLDPAATRVVLVELVAFGLLLVGAARQLRRWPLEWIVSQFMALAVAVALVGIVQEALLDDHTNRIYGFWQPRQGGDVFGPFVNRNHFAGWMVMMLPLVAAFGWAVALDTRPGRRLDGAGAWMRWLSSMEGNRVLLVVTCVFVMSVALVLTASRSGMAAAAVSMLVLLYFMWRALAGRARLVVTSAVVGGAAIALLWAGAGTVAARFGRASTDAGGRLSAWQDSLRLVADFPWFGTGLGGYRSAMLVYQTRDREAIYVQAHNDYLQLLAEGGLLVVVPALVLIWFVVRGINRRLAGHEDSRPAFWIRRGAVAGLAGIAAQSVVEFSLQMPGNAALLVVLAAIALHRPRSYSHAHRV